MLALVLEHLTVTLLELTLVFALSVLVGFVFLRLRMPPVVGYLFAGALVGPQALGLVRERELVENLAEVGVIVLLFSVGMELSLNELRRLRRSVVLVGGAQIAGTVLLGTGVALAVGFAAGPAVFLGYLLALSSTAAITRLLIDSGDFVTPPGRLALSTCIAQDLAVVPMVLTLPLLAGQAGGLGASLLQFAGSLLAFAALAGATWLLVPRLLDIVSRTRSRELYLLTLLVSCLCVSVVTAMLGMSFALGAFLVGVVIGSSVHHHQASGDIEPFRDALSSLFFFSIGMLFDPGVLFDAPLLVVSALIAVIGGKAAIAYLAVRLSGAPTWVALRTALMLAQVGEFSFVLARIAVGQGESLLPRNVERAFLVVAVASIAATPLMFGLGHRLLRRLPAARTRSESSDLVDHVVVVGYGPIGQHLVAALRALGLPYRAIEMNADTVRAALADGVAIVQGDASRANVLRAVRIYRARLLVVATNDPGAVLRVVRAARAQHPGLHVLVRANYLADVPELQALGVDEIVPQELETSVEITARALRHLVVAEDEVERRAAQIRERVKAIGGRSAAPPRPVRGTELPVPVPGLRAAAFRIEPRSQLDGRSLAESHLRRATGLSVIAVERDGRTEVAVGPETRLQAGDVAVGIGTSAALVDAASWFRGPADGAAAR